jgi:glycosyltransferase involved in cell wall biosynthesis
MKILFNCSTNFVGGGVQTATNYILLAICDDKIDWYFAISETIAKELKKFSVDLNGFYIFSKSPARNKKQKTKLLKIETELAPDLVYTMSGPAYVRFKSIHVLGCSDGDLTHVNWLIFDWIGSFLPVFKRFLTVLYKMYVYRWANHWIFQTEVSRKGFSKRMLIPIGKTSVVSNSCGAFYHISKEIKQINKYNKLKILIPSAGWPHKNLEIIPRVAYELKQNMNINEIIKKIEFVFTLPQRNKVLKQIEYLSKKLDVQSMITNRGPFTVSEGPDLYANSFAVLLPTLLETFSAVFIESFASETPLMVSDRDFAKDICKGGALYFNPKSPKNIAGTILHLIQMDLHKREQLVQKGKNISKNLLSLSERYCFINEILLKVFDSYEKNRTLA